MKNEKNNTDIEEKKSIFSFNDVEENKVEKDIYEILGNELKKNSSVNLEIETINIKEQGKYEIDIEKISSDEAIIFKFDDGKYIIDLDEAFGSSRRKQK